MSTWMVTLLAAVLACPTYGQVIINGGGGTTAPQQNLDPPGSVSGSVVDAITGEPVNGATVTLQSFSNGGNYSSATTDRAGTFTAGKLQPGDYQVQANHANYQGILGLPNPSQMVTVASAKQSSDVTLRLMPGGTVAGKVIDDGGDPVSGCPVTVLGPNPGGGSAAYMPKGSSSTDDQGEYKLEGLTADRYLVFARCQESLPVERPLMLWHPELVEPAESWLPVYYPDNASPAGAQWLNLLPGGVITGIDFHLKAAPVTSVTGTLSGVSTGTQGTQTNITMFPADAIVDSSLAYGGAFDASTSTFQIPMVAPGSYRLVVASFSPQMESLGYASVPVTVGRVRPAPLLVQMHTGLTISGTVELAPSSGGGVGKHVFIANSLQNPGGRAPKPPPLGYLNFIQLSPTPFPYARQVEVRPDGSFAAHGFTPGRYKVVPQIASAQSMESVHFGATQAINGIFELAEGASGSLRVRMGGSPVDVSVSLGDAPAGVAEQWTVFALPAGEAVGPSNQLLSAMGKRGDTVHMQIVEPGKFAFVAVVMSMAGTIQNERLSQLLRSQLEPVEIVPGQEQTVKAKYFTGHDIEKLALAYLRGETR